MPHTPFRYVLNTLLYILITGCRWCDVPQGKHWASKSLAHRWLKRWQEDGTLERLQSRVLGIAQNQGRPIKNDIPRFQQERCFAWYQKKYRRLVVRWERQSSIFDGFLALGMIHLWINKIILVG